MESDVLLLSKVRNLINSASGTSASPTDLSYPIRNQYSVREADFAREAVRTTASLANSASLALSLSHLLMWSLSSNQTSITNNCTDRKRPCAREAELQIGLSCTDRPLSHRSASLAQITWEICLLIEYCLLISQHRSHDLVGEADLCREADLCERGRSVWERPICAREADL